jgi:CheY-like chemotaxis protein
MPASRGRMVAEQILDSHPDTRVLYVSGYTNDDVVRTGVLRDAVPFVQKPFAPEAIAHKHRAQCPPLLPSLRHFGDAGPRRLRVPPEASGTPARVQHRISASL